MRNVALAVLIAAVVCSICIIAVELIVRYLSFTHVAACIMVVAFLYLAVAVWEALERETR